MKIKKSGIVIISLFFLGSIIMGLFLGWSVSETRNIINSEYITDFDTALPTKLLDINGEIITEFASDEKREIIAYNNLPQQMIDALITREDNVFFSHAGFNLKAIMRGLVGILTRRSLGGGSTLTQQIAGTLYCDRSDKSVVRKLKELWWAIQMERRYSTLAGFGLSLCIECLQLLLRVGFFELTDLVMNTLGAFVGVLISTGLRKVVGERSH